VPSFFAYIRVSTAKQGEGVSLPQQRDSIIRYAERSGLSIGRWFEERVTAAKRGRPVFSEMLTLLQQGKASGVIIHKIDRSARNLRDWADLGELIDRGIDVRFANESLDLQTRGGRLSADIQAVVAADYIRNLREEARKGIYGRLKQGLYPMPAPLGYLDRGAGKPKSLDPEKGPMVRTAFELYSTGRFTLGELESEMARRGLRNRNGGIVSLPGWSVILNNSFYRGVINVRSTGETYHGVHEPLVTADLFRRVQGVLRGKVSPRTHVHEFLFRRVLTCGLCRYSLIGERQKGQVYYRCHTRGCATHGIREDIIEARVEAILQPLQFSADEQDDLHQRLISLQGKSQAEAEQQKEALSLRLGKISERMARLTDAFIDGDLERRLFDERKAMLLEERRSITEVLSGWETKNRQLPDRLAVFLELAGNACLLYKAGDPDEKRALLRIVTSSRSLTGKSLDISLLPPFKQVAERLQNADGGPSRNSPRTWGRLFDVVGKFLSQDASADRILEFAEEKSTKMTEGRKGEAVAA
jgi:site-specific DNA recombinase